MCNLNCTTSMGIVRRTIICGKNVGYAPCNIGINMLKAKLFSETFMINNNAFKNILLRIKSKKLETIIPAEISAGMNPIKINSPSIYSLLFVQL